MDETEEFEFRARAERETAPAAPQPSMSNLESAGQSAVGAGKEAVSQVEGFAKFATPGSSLEMLMHPQQTLKSVEAGAQEVGHAIRHPVDTARGAMTDWFEKVLPTPTTPKQAQERGKELFRGAEAVAQGGSIIGDVAKVGAAPIERTLAPMAEKVASKGEAAVAEAAAAVQERNDLIKDVRKLGLKLTSQDVGAPIGKRVEALASRPQLEREISLSNAAKVKEAAAADVGIQGPLTSGAVNKAINETIVSYRKPRGLGRVELAADEEWQKALQNIPAITSQEQMDFPEDVMPQIDKEVAKFNKPSADADSIVNKISKLRERASDNFAGNADDKALARAQRKIATSMEEALERHAEKTGQSGVMAQFRADRTRLAKLYSIKDSMTETGELNLGVLEKELNKGEPLTGNLRTLARAKAAFDRSFQNPENIRGHPIGAGDVALAVVAGAGQGAGAGALAAAARPTTRAVLGSRLYQDLAIKPHVPKTGLVTRAARHIARSGRIKTPLEAAAEVEDEKPTLKQMNE